MDTIIVYSSIERDEKSLWSSILSFVSIHQHYCRRWGSKAGTWDSRGKAHFLLDTHVEVKTTRQLPPYLRITGSLVFTVSIKIRALLM